MFRSTAGFLRRSVPVLASVMLLAACSAPKQSGSQPAAPSQTQSGAPAQSSATPAKPQSFSVAIATQPQGSGYNATGAGIAKVLTEKSSVKATVKPYAGPNAWMSLIESGEVDLGISAAPDAGWAFKGTNGYPKPNKNVRMLVNGNILNVVGIAVRADAGIHKISDLKGKRVTADYAGNVIAKDIVEGFLASGGLTWNDVKSVPTPDIVSGHKALRENKVDAAFGAAPTTASVVEVDTATDLIGLNYGDTTPDKISGIAPNVLKEIQSRVPGSKPVLLKGKVGFVNEDTTGLGYPVILVASAKMDDEAAYQITKTLYEHAAELHPIHDWLKGWNPETYFSPTPGVPYHPGAIKYFKEKGLWTDAVDKVQQQLMSLAK